MRALILVAMLATFSTAFAQEQEDRTPQSLSGADIRGESKTQIEESSEKVDVKRFGMHLYNLAKWNMESTNRRAGELTTENYVGVNYKLKNGVYLETRQNFNTKEDYQSDRKDLEFLVIDPEVFKVDAFSGYGWVSYSLPTSENAANAQHRGVLTVASWFIYDINETWSVAYSAQPYYWLNSRNENVSETIGADRSFQREVTGNRDMRLLQQAGVTYAFTPKFSFNQFVITDQSWYRAANNYDNTFIRGTRKTSLQNDSSFLYTPTPQLKVYFGVNNDQDFEKINSKAQPYIGYRESDCIYYINTIVSI